MKRNFEIITVLLVGLFLTGCKTVPSNIIPTATSTTGSQPCSGKIQAAEPEIVRPAGVGGTDSTEYGYWAMEPRAASTSAGILVTWQTGVNGQYPVPNGYVRLLDDSAHPIGEISLPFERSMVQTPHFTSREDGALLTFCSIYPNDNSRITSVLLDPYGKFISEQRRFSAVRFGCGDERPNAVWTGSRLLFVWSPQSYPPDSGVTMEITDAKGSSLVEKKFLPAQDPDPRFAFGHERVLMIASVRTGSDFLNGDSRGVTHLVVSRFDKEGNELGESMVLEQRGGWEFGSGYVVPTEKGWLLLASIFRGDGFYYFAQLAQDGSLASGPELVETATASGFLDVVPYGGGAAALLGSDGFSASRVWFFSADGYVRQEWRSAPHEYMDLGGLVVHKGRLFVTYATKGEGKPMTNQVLIRELQCIP